MAKPHIHAQSSAKSFGGRPEDYLDIHEFLDASKAALGDCRHRALTHNAWFLSQVLPRVFGATRTNSDGRTYSVRDVGEQHVLEDYRMRFIPTAQDFLQLLPIEGWMNNGAGGDVPPSAALLTLQAQRGRNRGKLHRLLEEQDESHEKQQQQQQQRRGV